MPLLAFFTLEVELVVDADAEEIFGQAGIDAEWETNAVWCGSHASCGRAGPARGPTAEINVKVFGSSGPIVGKGNFHAKPGGPAGLGVGGLGAVEGRLHIGKGAAGGAVEEDTIHRPTHSSAYCGQPIVSGLTRTGNVADGTAGAGVDPGPIPIALHAEDERVHLIIEAERATNKASVIIGSA